MIRTSQFILAFGNLRQSGTTLPNHLPAGNENQATFGLQTGKATGPVSNSCQSTNVSDPWHKPKGHYLDDVESSLTKWTNRTTTRQTENVCANQRLG